MRARSSRVTAAISAICWSRLRRPPWWMAWWARLNIRLLLLSWLKTRPVRAWSLARSSSSAPTPRSRMRAHSAMVRCTSSRSWAGAQEALICRAPVSA